MGYSPLFIRLQDGLSEDLRNSYQINVAVTIDLRPVRHEVVRDFMYVERVDARSTTIRWIKPDLMELDPSQSLCSERLRTVRMVGHRLTLYRHGCGPRRCYERWEAYHAKWD